MPNSPDYSPDHPDRTVKASSGNTDQRQKSLGIEIGAVHVSMIQGGVAPPEAVETFTEGVRFGTASGLVLASSITEQARRHAREAVRRAAQDAGIDPDTDATCSRTLELIDCVMDSVRDNFARVAEDYRTGRSGVEVHLRPIAGQRV